MYVVFQLGDFLFKCPPTVGWQKIVALVPYTVGTFFCLKYCCTVEGQQIRNQIGFYIMFTYFSKKLEVFN